MGEGAKRRDAGKNILKMLGLFLQWYMVVFITLSMHTIKTNLLTSVFELLRVTF